MTLQDLLFLKPYALPIRQKLIMHIDLIKFSNESIVDFAIKHPDIYENIKDLIPIEFKTPEVTLMDKVMCYKL